MVHGQLARPVPVSSSIGGIPLADELSDGQLLERFVRGRDETAFATLVSRHGPMVLAVCRRMLRNAQDAEDAFQATFLVLVRKAPSLQKPELLAGWLHGVAHRTAQHARARAALRGRKEREAAMPEARNDPPPSPYELKMLIDGELACLPEKYRLPLILCYLEGKTNEEAARTLGWPAGSMSYRLTRGRQMLRDRLVRRRALLAAMLPAALADDELRPAFLPPLLGMLTVHEAVALLGSTGGDLVTPSVRELMEATLASLAASRWRRLLPLLLGLLVFLALGATIAGIVQAAWRPPDPPPTSSCH